MASFDGAADLVMLLMEIVVIPEGIPEMKAWPVLKIGETA